MARRGKPARKGSQHRGSVSLHTDKFQTTSSSSSNECSTLSVSDTDSSEHGSSYFAQFSDFEEEPGASLTSEMARLAVQEKWSKKEKQRQRLDAFDAEFARHFGTDMGKLEMWQEMCCLCRIEDIPTSITQCKKALAKVHLNIFNFLDHCRNPKVFELKLFRNISKLREYTVPNFIYPLKRAKADTFIKALLRPFGFTHYK
ncbi:hypothetical protein HBH70_064700 [Parastagonospora nodorum]|nr:hypothetical protein HBH52_142830 [Parastagonospora nodorum]KAH3980664.1 hypothetical protein HBH51_048770 [Parastagonospora nodorum]KAH4004207.1 hypothetical protein HBI10_049740 [Parastagonospora nodorum]KAH4018486.1 hypothetical protein HBI13_133380 [Parastagonospora nodorum]KAH4038603.1 hypothetical protein HBI09_053370 [Parastagonospora nodorum]